MSLALLNNAVTSEILVEAKTPLCVDLDGTVVRTDLLLESVMLVAKQQPWLIPLFPLWLLRGRAVFKRRIAENMEIDFSSLPFNEPLCQFLREQRALNRRIGLFTAADEKLAKGVAERLGLFEIVRASDGATNLAGPRKLAEIRSVYGDDFVYAGDGRIDCEIWRAAKAAIVVGRSSSLRATVEKLAPVERIFSSAGQRPGHWLAALRVHQWSKNLMLFVPAGLALPILSLDQIPLLILGFLIFSLLASAGYLLNDLLDLEADRKHETKRNRPVAAGIIPIGAAMAGSVALSALSIGLPIGISINSSWVWRTPMGAFAASITVVYPILV